MIRRWVAVAHAPGDAPRGLVAFAAADARCAAEYVRAWLSVHAPALPASAVFVNGVRFDWYPVVGKRLAAFVALTVQRERARRRAGMVAKLRAWNAAKRRDNSSHGTFLPTPAPTHNPPAAGRQPRG